MTDLYERISELEKELDNNPGDLASCQNYSRMLRDELDKVTRSPSYENRDDTIEMLKKKINLVENLSLKRLSGVLDYWKNNCDD
jgi:hypothetical protein